MDEDAASPSSRPDLRDDFRASAASFSQLGGVLGGFCITMLVLVLDSDQLEEHQSARDWLSGLIIFAALSYIFSAGVLANSLNSLAIASRSGDPDEGRMFATQRAYFRAGIAFFLLGNLPLGGAVLLIAFQFSLRVGLASSAAAAVGVLDVLLANLGVGPKWRPLPLAIRVASMLPTMPRMILNRARSSRAGS